MCQIITDRLLFLYKFTIFSLPFTIYCMNRYSINCGILYVVRIFGKKMLIGIVGSLLVHGICRVATNVMSPLIERMTNDNKFEVMRVCQDNVLQFTLELRGKREMSLLSLKQNTECLSLLQLASYDWYYVPRDLN